MYNNRKLSVYLPIILALVLLVGFFLGAILIKVSTIDSGILDGIKKRSYDPVSNVISYITQEYVDTISVDLLQQSAITGILSNLDPHSQYITAEEFNEVNDPLLGNFEGIGVQFRIESDTVYIVNTIPGGPSEKVGIMAGDRIIKVGDKLIAGVKITNNEVMHLLKGERGTKVSVSIFRKGVDALVPFDIIRDIIPTYSVDIAFVPRPGIGYIKLSKFSATTPEEFRKALTDLKLQGIKKLILDLRGNSGGYLHTAIDVADEFLEDGRLIVYTEGAHRPRQTAYATARGSFETGELMVLIDEGSASSSEIVAGAIQDNDRGTIIGRRSFGKGLVQEQLSLPDGSAVRLTVARYYTPTGRSIQKPYTKGHADEYMDELMERMVNGEYQHADSIHFNDSLKFTTPGGKTVYGGGGIMPDVYIPVETNEQYKYFNELLSRGLIYQFTFEYTDANRARLRRYGNFANFDRSFEVSPELFEKFIQFSEEKGVKRNPAGINFNKHEIQNLIKALISRNLYNEEGFYPIYLRTDETFQKALEIFNKDMKV